MTGDLPTDEIRGALTPEPTSLPRRLSGSTGGESPVTDAAMRGLIIGAIQSLLLVFGVRYGVVTEADVGQLAPAITVASFLLWGAIDWIDKRRRE